MSKAGKFLFGFAIVFFILLLGYRIVYGGWQDGMWVPLGLSIVCFSFGLVKDRKAIMGFFTMRTTKHGMNMGALILLVLAGLVCANFLAVRYEKTFDWTSDKLNSLSDQSKKVAQGLRSDTQIVLLYRNDQKQGENIQRAVRDLVQMFENVTPKIKFAAYNVLQHPELAQKYEFTNGASGVYAVQGPTHIKIDQPNEEGVTRALLKFGREHRKIIYFTVGHGERQLDGKDEEGLSSLREDLAVTYDVKPLMLYQVNNKVPDDADAVAIIRPDQQLLEAELNGLRDYAKRGGHLFIAADPGTRGNIALLTKTLGIEFENNYVLDLRSQVIRSGPATVLGSDFSRSNDITKAFELGTFAIFHIASALKADPSAAPEIKVDAIVSTDRNSMAIPELKDQVNFAPNGPHAIMMQAEGRLKGTTAQSSPKEFSAVVAGDSDFVANRVIHSNLNRDLTLNSFAYLMADKDLISIRPKEPRGTKLEMTNSTFALWVLGFLLPLPLILFFFGGFTWWRRRAA